VDAVVADLEGRRRNSDEIDAGWGRRRNGDKRTVAGGRRRWSGGLGGKKKKKR
jgi:hypothetical protein